METLRISTITTTLITISLLIGYTNAQITWSIWNTNTIPFGLESSAYALAGPTSMYTGGGNSSLAFGSNSVWRYSFVGTDTTQSIYEPWSGGCTVYDATSQNAYFFGGVFNNGSVVPYVQVFSIFANLDFLYNIAIPQNIILGEGIRCVLDASQTVHLFGGKQNSSLHATFFLSDGSWNVLAGMPEGKYQHGAALLGDGLIYVFGGINTGGSVTDTVYAYNASGLSWSVKPSLPQVNAYFASTTTNDNSRIYIVGGSSDPDRTSLGAYDSVCYYSLDSPQSWTTTTSFPFQMKGSAAVIQNNFLYTAGGRLANGTITDAKWKGTISGLPSASATPSRSPTPGTSASPSVTPSISPSNFPTPSSSPAPNSGDGGKSNKSNLALAVGIGVGVPLGLIAILVAVFVIFRTKKKNEHSESSPSKPQDPEAGNKVDVVKTSSRVTDVNSDYSGRWFIDYKEIQQIKELGKGAFGVVYLSKWRNSDCVVKQLNMEKSDENSVKEFLKEAENMRNLKSHPNICWIYGVCANPENPICIVMEYLPDGSLFDLIFIKGQQVTAVTAIQIGKDVASGMAHLHAENLLHCDLACRNLLVAAKGIGKFTVKIADFGLSKSTESGIYNASENKKFPIRWSAPEVLRAGIVSKASDVWSFGIVMWEMIESQRPYTELSNEEVVKAVSQNGYRLARPSRIEIPDDLWKLMLSCWDANPASRPTFGDIYQTLCLIEKNYIADHGSEQNSESEFSLERVESTDPHRKSGNYSKWGNDNNEQQPLSKRPSHVSQVSQVSDKDDENYLNVENEYQTKNSQNSNAPKKTEKRSNNNNNNSTNNSTNNNNNSTAQSQNTNITRVQEQEEIYNTKIKKSNSAEYAVRLGKQLTADQTNQPDESYAQVTFDNNQQ